MKKQSILLLVASAALLAACGTKGGNSTPSASSVSSVSSQSSAASSSEKSSVSSQESSVSSEESSESKEQTAIDRFAALDKTKDSTVTRLEQHAENIGYLGDLAPETISEDLAEDVAVFDEAYSKTATMVRYDGQVFENDEVEIKGAPIDSEDPNAGRTVTQIYVNEKGGLQYAVMDYTTYEVTDLEYYTASEWKQWQKSGLTFEAETSVGEASNALYNYKWWGKKEGFAISIEEAAENEGAEAVSFGYTEVKKFNTWALGVTAPVDIDITVEKTMTVEFKDGIVVYDAEYETAKTSTNPFTGDALEEETILYQSLMINSSMTAASQGPFTGKFIHQIDPDTKYVLAEGDNTVTVTEDEISIDTSEFVITGAGALCAFKAPEEGTYVFSSPNQNVCFSIYYDGMGWAIEGGFAWGEWSDYTLTLKKNQVAYFEVSGSALDDIFTGKTAADCAGTFTINVAATAKDE